jgi:hypothetical protein
MHCRLQIADCRLQRHLLNLQSTIYNLQSYKSLHHRALGSQFQAIIQWH